MPTVLVVDDEPVVLQLIQLYLAEAGFESVALGSASEALAWLANKQVPDLLVLDVLLPDMSGPELALRIQAWYPRIPVLFLSAWPELEVVPRAMQLVGWRFLPKPFSGTEFIDEVRRLLGLGSQMALGFTA